jgi:hypothetical protein
LSDLEQPSYERFDNRADFNAAVDRLLEQPGRELRVFDPDLSALMASRTRRLYAVVHNTEHITRHCPRLMTLLARYAHAIQINRTHEEIRELKDAFLVLDASHYVRRPVAQFFRGAIGLGDETDGLTMRARFMEIWAASYPAVSSTIAGL